MKIGYSSTNWSFDCRANSTFRIGSYSRDRFIKTVKGNLDCLKKILEYNISNDILFFRISSDILPFAGHSILNVNWRREFKKELSEIGKMIKNGNVRISMHPGQYLILNSPNDEVVRSSVRELKWHCQFMDAMGLDNTAKVQFHVGGVYGNRSDAMSRFVNTFLELPNFMKKRAVLENDDSLYGVSDCLLVSYQCNVPLVLDVFHHSLHNAGETLHDALLSTSRTWGRDDGLPMVDYSSQEKGALPGRHAKHIDPKEFMEFIKATSGYDFDIMLEIKDKEKSVFTALNVAKEIRGVLQPSLKPLD